MSKNVSKYNLHTLTERSFATETSEYHTDDFIGNSVFKNQKKSKKSKLDESSVIIQSSKILEQDSTIINHDYYSSKKKNRDMHNKFVT